MEQDEGFLLPSEQTNIIILRDLGRLRTFMIHPQLKHIFDNTPQNVGQKLEDWWKEFGPVDIDKRIKKGDFKFDYSKVIRKNKTLSKIGILVSYYEGQVQLKNGKQTGIGRKVIIDEFFIQIFEGNFQNGVPNGYCREINSDMECYMGYFKDGYRHG